MKLGIFAKTYQRADLDDLLSQMVQDGLHVTQFNLACVTSASMPDEISPTLTTRIRQSFAAHKVEMVAVSGTFNMIHPDPAVVQVGLQRLEVLAQAASQMGTGMITLCTGTRDPRDQWGYHPDNESPSAWVDLLSAMEQALTIAMKHNITLGIEPEKANVISSAFKARNLLDHFQSPHLKIIMDPANLFEHEGPDEVRRIVEEAFALLASDIALAHAKDRTANGNFVAAGQGVLDYAHYIEQLKTINYAGALILHGLTEQEVPACVQFLQERLQSNA